MAAAYLPFIQRFRGKQWVFYPRALELPEHTDGNIFRLKDDSIMVPVVSYWKAYRDVDQVERNLEVVCRLPDAEVLQHVYVASLDLKRTWKVKPRRDGSTLVVTLPEHGRGTVILLSARPDAALEAQL